MKKQFTILLLLIIGIFIITNKVEAKINSYDYNAWNNIITLHVDGFIPVGQICNIRPETTGVSFNNPTDLYNVVISNVHVFGGANISGTTKNTGWKIVFSCSDSEITLEMLWAPNLNISMSGGYVIKVGNSSMSIVDEITVCISDTWSCGSWGACSIQGAQARTCNIISDCSSVNTPSPSTTQTCTYIPPTCTSWVYSDWSTCSASGQQTRTIISSSPSGCAGGSPVTSQSCTYTAPICTSWVYSDWSTCSASGQQTRTITSSLPSNCAGGNSIISQTCTFDSSKIPSTITSFSPQAIEPGDVITISGSNFGDVQGPSKLIVGGSESVAGVITSWTDKEIKYRTSVLYDAKSKKIGIKKCSSYSVCLNPVYAGYYYIQPVIDSLDKLSGAIGDVVVIYGKNLESSNIDSDDSGSSYGIRIYINNIEASYIKWENNDVVFAIPNGATSGYVKVEIYDKGTPDKAVAMGPYFKVLGLNTSLISKDTYAEKQTYLNQINMPAVWAMGIPQRKVVVAIIDDGVYTNHEDYVGSTDFWVNKDEIPNNGIDDDKNGYVDDSIGWDFARNTNILYPVGTHGTMVAGLIKSTKDNNKGIAGINQNAIIMPLIVFKAAKDGAVATKEAIIKAIKYAVDNGAEVINLSLGSNQYSGIVSYSDAFNEAIKYANSKGAIIIVAAGNGDDFKQGANLNVTPDSPVCNDNGNNLVIGVGAVDSNNNRTSWSNYGDNCVDIWAPGENIISTAIQDDTVTIDKFLGNGWYLEEDGTSFAAPIVAGVVSLLKAKFPSITPSEIVGILKNNSNNGIIDAYRVLTASYSVPVPSPSTSGNTTENKKVVENENKDNTNKVVEEEKKLITKVDSNLSKRVSGNILLQVEKNGEGWYIYPDDKKKYYLGRPADAFSIMRNLGLGIKHSELTVYLDTKFPSRLSGKIVLDVEKNGEAYYVNPKDLKGYFLSRPADAFKVMRDLGLGITNTDIRKIGVGEIK